MSTKIIKILLFSFQNSERNTILKTQIRFQYFLSIVSFDKAIDFLIGKNTIGFTNLDFGD